MKILDGSEGEGGGQIIRNSICYAALLQQDLRIHSVRKKRSKPGLRAQHLTGLKLAADICGGSLVDAHVGSEAFEYHPKPKPMSKLNPCKDKFEAEVDGHDDDVDVDAHAAEKRNTIMADIKTAGSICLLFQVGLPCMLYSNSRISHLELRGGTNADMAPQIDYTQQVFLPIISRHCFRSLLSMSQPISESASSSIASDANANTNVVVANIDIQKRGYFPVGKGVASISLHGALKEFRGPMEPIVMKERGHVVSISITAFYAGKLPRFVAKKMADSALQIIQGDNILNSSIATSTTNNDVNVHPIVRIIQHKDGVGSASGILIVATTNTGCIFGGSSLGTRGEDAVVTGRRAAQEILKSIHDGGCVDDWLQDQLIIFMALAKGESQILTGSLTQHTRSAIDVATTMTDAKFDIVRVAVPVPDPDPGESTRCSGSTTSPDTSKDALGVGEGNLYSDLDPNKYGKDGCIPGKHIIRCRGIGFVMKR
jgi:RNA 3'-terminal phosphate cyclase (ATP)